MNPDIFSPEEIEEFKHRERLISLRIELEKNIKSNSPPDKIQRIKADLQIESDWWEKGKYIPCHCSECAKYIGWQLL